MLGRLTLRRNTFQETLLGLEYTPRPDRSVDLFSRACVEQYHELNLTRFGYLFAQVFEPDVLKEVALLEEESYVSLADLSHRPTAATIRLAELVQNAADLPVIGLVNLASALISISRFDLAVRILEQATVRAADPRESFEIAMLEFVVSNRRDNGTASRQAFLRMRKAIEAGSLPYDRVMDACAQAIVWYLKRRELSEADFNWYLATGNALAKAPERLDPGSISSWYRALAMLPASRGEARATRRYMQYAREAAGETFTRRPRAYEMHYMKTYYESSLKEHMYVAPDLEKAEEAGHALITLDPAWAPSYGELAEAYLKFGKPEQAARLYDKAVETGPPYVGHHLSCAAKCYETVGNNERALAHYLTLSELAPQSVSVLLAGLKIARGISHESRGYFQCAIDRLKSATPGGFYAK